MNRSIAGAGPVYGRLQKSLIFLLAVWTALSVQSTPAKAADYEETTVTVFPQEINDVLHNPDMGWVYIDNAIPNHIDVGRTGTYPEIDNIAVLSNWGELEPQEGQYDWSLVDQAIAYWSGLGKKIHFRISTDAMLISGYGYSKGVPDWLFAPPYSVGYQERYDQGYTFKLPDYTNPVYLEKLESFLAAFADRYRNTGSLELVDLRAYGTWGEWHSGHDFDSYAERMSSLAGLIDSWYDAWGEDKLLAISNSYEWRSEMQPAVSNPPTYQDYLTWSAFDHALGKPQLTFRRDGAAGALGPYDTRLLTEFFRSNRNLPIVAEFFGVYAAYKQAGGLAGYTPDTALDEALSLRPNYITIMGHDADTSAPQFYSERPDLVAKGNRMMGYRFVLKKASYPSVVKQGGALTLDQLWTNEAVGRSYRKYPLKLILTDASGNEIWSAVDASFDQTSYVRGEAYRHESRFTIPAGLAQGTYDLRVAMVDPVTGVPRIKLAIAGADSQLRYKLGTIQVKGTADTVTIPELKENFEGGSFAGTSFSAGFNGTYGQMTNAPAKVVSGSYSVVGSAPATTDWYEFLYSNRDRYALEGGATYKIAFSYRPLAAPGANGFYYFFARSTDGGADKGVTQWTETADGSVKTRTVTVTLDRYDDYFLVWGLHNGGELSVDNVSIVKLSDPRTETFESGTFAGSEYTPGWNNGGTLTSDPARRIEGSYSAFGSALPSAAWTEFLYSDSAKLHLDGNATYTVTFDYKAYGQPADGGYFYFMARTNAGGIGLDKGFTSWRNDNGETGSKTVTFTLANHGDYYLIWGLRQGGAVAIDRIRIVKHPGAAFESFEAGSFAQSLYTGGHQGTSGSVTSASAKRIDGTFAVNASSAPSVEWKEFLYSDPAKLALKPNSTYEVTFRYRSHADPGKGGYYYFLARSGSGGTASDRGFTQWYDKAGADPSVKTVIVRTGAASDYYLIWGIHNGGDISIDEITVRNV